MKTKRKKRKSKEKKDTKDVRILRDTSGQIERIAKRLIKKREEFDTLRRAIKRGLRILYLWKIGASAFYNKKEGTFSAAETKKLSNYTRDVFGFDVSIAVHQKTWKDYVKKDRKRTLFHQLMHIDPQENANFKAERDKYGRLEVTLRPPDVVVTTFSEELEAYGLDPNHVSDTRKLAIALQKRDKKKKKGT